MAKTIAARALTADALGGLGWMLMADAWPEAGEAMLNTISVLRGNLEQVDDKSIVILAIF